MLAQIKAELIKHCKPEDKKGLFFSLFDVNGKPISGRDMKLTVEDGIARFERLPSVVYLSAHAVGNGHMEKILAILKKPENLNQEYWGKPKP